MNINFTIYLKLKEIINDLSNIKNTYVVSHLPYLINKIKSFQNKKIEKKVSFNWRHITHIYIYLNKLNLINNKQFYNKIYNKYGFIGNTWCTKLNNIFYYTTDVDDEIYVDCQHDQDRLHDILLITNHKYIYIDNNKQDVEIHISLKYFNGFFILNKVYVFRE